MQQGFFDELTELLGVDLYSNSLTALPVGDFNELANLTYLNLNDNELTDTEQDRIRIEVRALPEMVNDWDIDCYTGGDGDDDDDICEGAE